MFRRIEPDGRPVWYFGPQIIYFLLALIVVIFLLEELTVPSLRELYTLEVKAGSNVYAAVYESRINALVRASSVTLNVTSSKNRTAICPRMNRHSGVNGSDYRAGPTLFETRNGSYKNRSDATLEDIAKQHGDMEGGAWKPRDCIARHRVAIIIPYRDRLEHLTQLLAVLVPFLKAQNLHFRIYLPEQDGALTFNKGVLMNAAFLEALRDQPWDCFVFHDVDLMPENNRIVYSCPRDPRHVSVAIDEMGYELPYDYLVGGVFILRTEHYIAANGYSNEYWGWGAEDDDMAKRIKKARLRVERLPYNVARFRMIQHVKREPAEWTTRILKLRLAEFRIDRDGVNSVKYDLVSRTNRKLYTHLLINVGVPPPS